MPTDLILQNKVREIMAETFDVAEEDIPANVKQQEFAPWSSLEQLTLLVALEEQFKLSFSIVDMNAMTSLPAIVSVLEKHGIRNRQESTRSDIGVAFDPNRNRYRSHGGIRQVEWREQREKRLLPQTLSMNVPHDPHNWRAWTIARRYKAGSCLCKMESLAPSSRRG